MELPDVGTIHAAQLQALVPALPPAWTPTQEGSAQDPDANNALVQSLQHFDCNVGVADISNNPY